MSLDLTNIRTKTRKTMIHQEKKFFAQSLTLKIHTKPGFMTKKRVDNNYVLNKTENPRTVTAVQSLI